MATLQHVLGQPLRAAGVGQARVQNGFHQGVAAADYIADHKQVGLQRNLVGGKAFDQLNVQRTQLIAHRRVDVGVTTRDLVPRLARQRRQSAHEGAADTEDVDVHGSQYLSQRFTAFAAGVGSAQCREGCFGCVHRIVDVGGAVRVADKTGFVQGGCQVDAAVEHAVEKAVKALFVGGHHRSLVLRQRSSEEEAKHAALAVADQRHTRVFRRARQSADE